MTPVAVLKSVGGASDVASCSWISVVPVPVMALPYLFLALVVMASVEVTNVDGVVEGGTEGTHSLTYCTGKKANFYAVRNSGLFSGERVKWWENGQPFSAHPAHLSKNTKE